MERRGFFRRFALALGSGMAGFLAGTTVAAQPPPGDFDFWRDAPLGVVAMYEGSLSAHENLPAGADPKWSVIGSDRVPVGTDSALLVGTEGGSESLTSEGAHAGGAVGDHAFTNPASHDDHLVTQPGSHDDHAFTNPDAHADHPAHASTGAHTHDDHVVENRQILLGTAPTLTSPVSHSSDGGHTHDAHSAHGPHTGGSVDPHSAHAGGAVDPHSAHVGGAVDPHAVTQANPHAVKKWRYEFLLRKDVA